MTRVTGMCCDLRPESLDGCSSHHLQGAEGYCGSHTTGRSPTIGRTAC